MNRLTLTAHYDSSPEQVWAQLADLASHAEWMTDAGGILFVGDQTSGLGTRMRVPTRIGPLRTDDLMTVVEWEEGRLLGVRHSGAVSGVGRFEIRPTAGGTDLNWSETLRFPWWLAGSVGVWLARPVLKRVWRGNLRRLGERLAVSDP